MISVSFLYEAYTYCALYILSIIIHEYLYYLHAARNRKDCKLCTS